MKKTNMVVAVAAVVTAAAGTAVQAEPSATEVAPVPAIQVSAEGDLEFSPEFSERIAKEAEAEEGPLFSSFVDIGCCTFAVGGK